MNTTALKLSAYGMLVALVTMSVFAFTQTAELKSKQAELIAANATATNLESLKSQLRQLTVINAINAEGTRGIISTDAETIKTVNQVITFILESRSPAESKFAECWDRKLKTTDWGSMGPFGLLDECIDTIVEAKTAILMKELDRARNQARYNCSRTSANNAEAARDCWADRNFRLIASADSVLFSFITTAEWFNNQKGQIKE